MPRHRIIIQTLPSSPPQVHEDNKRTAYFKLDKTPVNDSYSYYKRKIRNVFKTNLAVSLGKDKKTTVEL